MNKLVQSIISLIFIVLLLLTSTCKDDLLRVTKLGIGTASNETESTATISATFIDVSANITTYGFCWATTSKPQITDTLTVDNSTAKKGEFSLNLSGLSEKTKYYVRAYAMEGEKVIYSPDEISFTTLEAKYINISAPQVTYNWFKGSTQNISWTDNIDENVDIILVQGTNIVLAIAEDTPNSGTYSWEIPLSIPNATDYTIIVRSVADDEIAGQSEAFEISEAPYINIAQPTTGSDWQKGSTQTISWTDNIIENVKIELFKAGTFHSEITNSTSSDGLENWTLPMALEASADYTIKITSVADISLTNESQVFQISDSPYISITSPVSMDHWMGEELREIKWTSNISKNLIIALYSSDNIIAEIVADPGTVNDGAYPWTIPDNIEYGNNYKIRISSVSNSNLYDESSLFKISEKTGSTGTMKDYDANIYSTIKIGKQWWMAKNLKVRHYPNGNSIPLVTDNTAWGNLGDNNTDDAYCYYDNTTNNRDTYGALYTWAAAMGDNAVSSNTNPSGVQGVCPTGWHLPSDAEWKELEMYLGMSQTDADRTGFRGTNEGSKLAGNSGLWANSSLETNTEFGVSGFTILPGGSRNNSNGTFIDIGYSSFTWTSTEQSNSKVYARTLSYLIPEINRLTYYKSSGFSVRCARD